MNAAIDRLEQKLVQYARTRSGLFLENAPWRLCRMRRGRSDRLRDSEALSRQPPRLTRENWSLSPRPHGGTKYVFGSSQSWTCQERRFTVPGLELLIWRRLCTDKVHNSCILSACDLGRGEGILEDVEMDNFFIAEYFDWRVKRFSLLDRLTSRVLSNLLGKTEFRSARFL